MPEFSGHLRVNKKNYTINSSHKGPKEAKSAHRGMDEVLKFLTNLKTNLIERECGQLLILNAVITGSYIVRRHH